MGSQANILGSVGSFWTDVAGVAGAAVAVALAVAIGAARRTNKSGNIASNSHTNFLQCITQQFSVSRFLFFPLLVLRAARFLSDSSVRGFSAFPGFHPAAPNNGNKMAAARSAPGAAGPAVCCAYLVFLAIFVQVVATLL